MAVPIKTAPTPEERALVKEALARLLAGKPRIATLQKRVRRGSLQTNLNALTLESGVSRHRIEKLYPDLAQAADEARGKRGETIPLRKQLDTARRDKQAAERRLEQSQSVSYHLMHRIAAYRSEVQMLKDRVAELERGLGGGAMDDLFFGSDDIVGIPSMPAPKRTRGRGANSTA